LLAIAGLLAAWLPALLHRSFDADEFEHSHAAWCVYRGMLPYRDFFEHHTPFYYYLLRPFFRWFAVDRSFASARHFLLCGRGLSLVLTILSVCLVTRLGHLLEHRDLGKERKLGLLAGLLLLGQPVFFEKSIEIRPDVLALPGLLGGLWVLLRGLARNPVPAPRMLRYCFAGGLCVGAAVMCTQKMFFALPGVLAGLAIWSLAAGQLGLPARAAPARRVPVALRILPCVLFLIGAGVPAALTWAVFSLQHAGGDFITNNFLLNARWKHIETYQLRKLLLTTWPILALGVLGSARWLAGCFRYGGRRYGELLLLCTVVGLFAGALVIPSAHGQYYLMPLPLVCLAAAQGLLFLVERVHGRASTGLLLLALVPLAVLPARAVRDSLNLRNDRQLARLRFVFERTTPEDVVMDGWEGIGVFRPHAFRYFFLHREIRAMLPTPELVGYLEALERGAIRPRLIAMDWNLSTLGPRFQHFVRMNYTSNDGFFYFRLGFWRPRGIMRDVRGF
jgi:hypothetical protein